MEPISRFRHAAVLTQTITKNFRAHSTKPWQHRTEKQAETSPGDGSWFVKKALWLLSLRLKQNKTLSDNIDAVLVLVVLLVPSYIHWQTV